MITRSLLTLSDSQREVSDELYAKYSRRPKNISRLQHSWFRASLRAVANRIALRGNPPTYNQRLGYRTAKRNRARKAMKELYGDPTKENPKGTT